MINAKILLDSLNPAGDRITTWILTYPRWVLAELNTHRALSRNTSSSRAIPVSKLIEQVKTNPAVPSFWGKNQPGMQADVELTGTELAEAKRLWLEGRDNAVRIVEQLNAVGLHKQSANRLLEPFLYVTSLITFTDGENFFGLRAEKDAQPEFRELAYLMLRLYQESEPTRLKAGEWHIPFGDSFDVERLADIVYKDYPNDGSYTSAPTSEFTELRIKIATARCARTSYLNFDGKDDYAADIKLTMEKLAPSGHWSAFEHCAEALPESTRCGNFVGWKQYRKFFPNENRSDGRVKRFSRV